MQLQKNPLHTMAPSNSIDILARTCLFISPAGHVTTGSLNVILDARVRNII